MEGMSSNILDSVLLSVLGQSDETRRAAELHLSSLHKQPDFYLAQLLQSMKLSTDGSVKQLAGVLIRQQIDAKDLCWDKAAPETRQMVQTELLQMMTSDNKERILRRTVAEAVGSMAIKALPNNLWPDFLPSLFQLGASQNEAHRVSVLLVLEKVLTIIPELVSEFKYNCASNLSSIRSLLQLSLVDSSAEVISASVSCVVCFLIAVSASERKLLVGFIPLLFTVFSSYLNSGNELSVRECLESLVRLVSCDATYFKPHLSEILNMFTSIISNSELDASTRGTAFEFLIVLAEKGEGMIRKYSAYAVAVVPLCFSFLLELEDSNSDIWYTVQTDEELEMEMLSIGVMAVDRISSALGGKIFCGIAFPIIENALASNDWLTRHAALVMLSEMAEGCSKIMKPKSDQILVNMIIPSMADQHPRVRWAAVNCVAQFCNDYAPSFNSSNYSTLLPPVVALLKDNVARVACHASLTLVDFCAGIEGESTDWFNDITDNLLAPLLELLQTSSAIVSSVTPVIAPNTIKSWLHVVEAALTAVAAIAHISQSSFVKYYDYFIPIVKGVLHANGKETRLAKGKAMECVGMMSKAVGKEKFSNDAVEVLNLLLTAQNAYANDSADDDPSRGYMIQALARICECVGSLFLPYLPHVIPPLLKSATIEAGRIVPDVGPETDNDEYTHSVVIALQGEGNVRLEYNTELLAEKALACDVLYTYAKELKGGFYPYVNDVLQALLPLVSYRFNEKVRVASVSALPMLMICIKDYALSSGQYTEQTVDSGLLRDVFNGMFDSFIRCVQLESDIDQLCNIIRSFTECVEVLTLPVHVDQMVIVAKVVNSLVIEAVERRKQREEKQKGEDMDEEAMEGLQFDDEMDGELLGFLIDFTSRMIKNGGELFAQVFNDNMAELIVKFLSVDGYSSSEKVTAICIFDDVIENGGKIGLQHIPHFFPICLAYFNHKEVELRQAALYGVGVIAVLGSFDLFAPHREHILKTLVSIVSEPDARSEENYPSTCGAVSVFGKICMHQSSGLDMSQLWPLWMSWLPVNGDEEEAKTVHKRFLYQVENNNSFLIGENYCNLPKIVDILSNIVFSIEVSDSELNTQISKFWKSLCSQMPAESVNQLLSGLSATQKEKLQDCLKFADL